MNGSKTAIVIIGAWVVLVGGTWLLWLWADLNPLWILVGVLAAIFVSLMFVALLLIGRMNRNKPHMHDRIEASREWSSPLEPGAAVDQVADLFGEESVVTRPGGDSVQIGFGSDSKFRLWGVYSDRGRKSFPVLLAVRAEPAHPGSTITAQARDDLGWYAVLVPRALEVGNDAVMEKLDMVERATGTQGR